MTFDAFTRDFGKRLGHLTGEQLQAALDRFELGDLIGAVPATGGNFGQNVLVSATSGEWVLRGRPHYPWQFPKERYFARLIAERTSMPAPWPYRVEESPEIFGWSYAIMPRLPGLQLDVPSVRAALTSDDEAGIATALGAGLGRLQELTWPHAGTYSAEEDGIVRRSHGHRATVLGELDEIQARCSDADLLSDADRRWIREIIEPNAEALNVPFEAIVVHGDFKESNVVVRGAGSDWQVSGVFDLMLASFGDPEEDLARPVSSYVSGRPHLAQAFIRGYVSGTPLRSGAQERFRVYMLRDRLMIWEFGLRPRNPRPSIEPDFRSWAEQFVRLDVAGMLG